VRWGVKEGGAIAAGLGTLFLAGCLVAAAGAGAGGGIYFTERGVESVVPVSMDRAASAARQALDELKVQSTKSATEQHPDGERREIDGTAGGRDVSVTLKAQGANSTRVQVVAKTSAVTWDKDFARTVVDKIVAHAR
jgi:Protein of unknown function (DUF3568)